MPRLLLYNIAYGQGLFGKRYQYLQFWRRLHPPKLVIRALARAIRSKKPDIVGLIEVDANSRRQTNQLQRIKDEVGLPFSDARVKYGMVGIGRALRRMPYFRHQSNGIISRYPFAEIIYHTLPRGAKRIASQYIIQCGKQRCSILLVHLPLGREARHTQLMELLRIINRIRGPVICLGDFNAPRHEIQAFMAASHLTDAHYDLKRSRKDEEKNEIDALGSYLTFPAHKPRRKIDHVLVSRHIKIEHAQVHPWLLSDHLPLTVDFSFIRVGKKRVQAEYVVD